MKARLKQYRQGGFTLIELLLVLIIIGLAASISVISIRSSNEDNLQQFTENLLLAFEQVVEEAVFTQLQVGVLFDFEQDESETNRYSYRFLVYDPEAIAWQAFETRLIEKGFFPAEIELTLEVDGENLVIGGENDKAITYFEKPKPMAESENERKRLAPDIVFFSSGEIQPFRLSLSALAKTDDQYLLKANLLGHLKLILPGETENEDE